MKQRTRKTRINHRRRLRRAYTEEGVIRVWKGRTTRIETRTGACRVTPDRIEITLSGTEQEQTTARRRGRRSRVIYTAFGVAGVVLAGFYIYWKAYYDALLPGIFAAIVFCYIRFSRDDGGAVTIPLAQVTDVTFKRGVLSFTRPRFLIRYRAVGDAAPGKAAAGEDAPDKAAPGDTAPGKAAPVVRTMTMNSDEEIKRAIDAFKRAGVLTS